MEETEMQEAEPLQFLELVLVRLASMVLSFRALLLAPLEAIPCKEFRSIRFRARGGKCATGLRD